MDPVRFGNRPAVFAGFEPVYGFPLLILSFSLRPSWVPRLMAAMRPSLGMPQDACALFLGQAGQQRQVAYLRRC